MSVQNSVEFNIDEDFGITEAIATLDNGDFGTRTLRFETGQLARQADGSVTTYLDDDTMLLATTTASNQPREGFDFFPLTVDVEERMYAAGKIPGSFFRREGRPSSEAILACRPGGIVSVPGVYVAFDPVAMGAFMNKGLTIRTAQQHGQRYLPRLFDYVVQGDLDPSAVLTHDLPLDDAVRGARARSAAISVNTASSMRAMVSGCSIRTKRHGWLLPADGAQRAASSSRLRSASDSSWFGS